MGIDQEKRNLTEAQKLRLVSGHDFWQSESIADVGIPAIRMSDGLMATLSGDGKRSFGD